MRKLRFSEAGCDENRTPRFHREVRSVIAPIDSTSVMWLQYALDIDDHLVSVHDCLRGRNEDQICFTAK